MARRLAAILAADVVGYSRLMGADETGTLERLKSLRKELVQPKVSAHGGRIVNLMGDGLLAEFSSVVEAVQCAVDIQQAMAAHEPDSPDERRIRLRIGVNLGDIIVEGSDIYGEGVNVAARLEGLAEPGGVCISGPAFDTVDGKLELAFEDIGPQQVKNIAKPIRAYRLAAGGTPGGPLEDPGERLRIPDKPSIAVLPFANMSGDPEQEYFADGIVEEIITALSHFRWLFVIARNSTFAYKGQRIDVKQVGRALGVHYVLEGSVRKVGNRVRITGQLVDTAMGAHLWADRFEGTLEDVFDLQDQVTANVVGAIAPTLERAEIERAKRKPTGSLGAYDYYLRGMAAFHLWTRDGSNEALSMFNRAIELDPGFAAAYGMAARCYSQRKISGWVTDEAREVAEAEVFARRAVDLGKDDALALATAGIAIAYVVGDWNGGNAFIDQALALNSNLAWAWVFSGYVKMWMGEPESAIERIDRAMRLSPQDSQIFNMQLVIALAHFISGRYAEASASAERAIRWHPNHGLATATYAASAVLAGRISEGREATARLQQVDPRLSISGLLHLTPFQRPEDRLKWIEALRKARLPE